MASNRTKSNKWCVYMHKSPNGKIYIGQTNNIKSRWRKSAYDQCTHFYNAICKYGWENFQHKVLFDNLTFEDANLIEIDLIFYFKKQGISLNITDGGQGSSGRKHSEISKMKISERLKGKPGWNKGILMREESKIKLSESLTGRHLSEEHKQKIKNNWNGGKKPIKVQQLDENNCVLNTFDSIADAERYLGQRVGHSHIPDVLKGLRQRACGFKWK